MTATTDETDRLRRELEEAFEMCRAIGEERNELAFKLGEEVAKNERLREAIVRVVPYVRATLLRGNRCEVPGKPEWEGVHVGRAESSIVQLTNLERLATKKDAAQ